MPTFQVPEASPLVAGSAYRDEPFSLGSGATVSRSKRLWFNRTVSDSLMKVLTKGRARELVDLAVANREGGPLFDLQLRRDTKGNNPVSWATLYYGLTSVLDLEERQGEVRLVAHPTHRSRGGFRDEWGDWQEPAELDDAWPQVSAYLQRVLPTVDKRWTGKEGAVHAAISSGASDAYRIINREVSPGFVDQSTKDALMAGWWQPLEDSLQREEMQEAWWPTDVTVGASPDFLAVDIGGRLAVIEAKHHSATGMIAKVPLQVGFYAKMFRVLLEEDDQALEAMEAMLRQRVSLGLSRPGVLYLTRRREVVPVVAIGPDRPSKAGRERLWKVALSTSRALGEGVDPIELWYVDRHGRIEKIERPGDVA